MKALPLLVISGSLAAGCSTDTSARKPVAVPFTWSSLGPFAPTTLRVHPLTHVERVPGGAEIWLHVEMRDRWGDGVKGVGKMAIRLFGPKDGMNGPEGEVLRWDVDLADLDRNVELFDPATRTYRIQLAGGPAWLQEFIVRPGTSGGGVVGGPARIMLQVTLDVRDGEGGTSRTLRDEFVMKR